MKKIKLFLTALGVFLLLGAGSVRASEGSLYLSDDKGGVCLGSSVFVDGRYRVLLSCRGLEMAADPIFNRYMVWSEEVGGKMRRLGEIEKGKLQASSDEAFTGLKVSLESEASPLRQEGEMVMSGEVEEFNFGREILEERTEEKDVSEIVLDDSLDEEMEDRGAVTPAVESTASGFSRVLSGVLKALLAGFVVVILIVGVSSYFSNRKRR